jgi:hypothetical protein
MSAIERNWVRTSPSSGILVNKKHTLTDVRRLSDLNLAANALKV